MGQDNKMEMVLSSEKQEGSFLHLQQEFVEGLMIVLVGDTRFRTDFLRSSKTALRRIDRLAKRNLLPFTDQSVFPDGLPEKEEYLKLVENTKTDLRAISKKWNSDKGEEVVDQIMTIMSPFVGLVGYADKKEDRRAHPDKIIKKYEDEVIGINKPKLNELWYPELAMLYGYMGTLVASGLLMITTMFVELERLTGISDMLYFSLATGSAAVLLSLASKAAKNEKEWNLVENVAKAIRTATLQKDRPMDFINDQEGGEILGEAIIDRLAKKREKENKGIGGELLQIMMKIQKQDPSKIDGTIEAIWGKVQVSDQDATVLKNAKAITKTALESLLVMQRSIAQRGLVAGVTGEGSNGITIKQLTQEYEEASLKLMDLLDKAQEVDYLLHPKAERSQFIAFVLLGKLMRAKITRRAFLTGGAAGLAALGAAYLKARFINPLWESYLGDTRENPKRYSELGLLPANLAARAGLDEEIKAEPDLKDEVFLSFFINQVKLSYGDELSYEEIKELEETIKNQKTWWLQKHTQLYFGSQPADKNQIKNYSEFIQTRYLPDMFNFAKALNLNIYTLLGSLKISGENPGGIYWQNRDVREARIQNIVGALGGYLSREWGVPVDDMLKMGMQLVKSYDFNQYYDSVRLADGITLGFHDMELAVMAGALGAIEDRKTKELLVYQYWQAVNSLRHINQAEKDLASDRQSLQKWIDTYLYKLTDEDCRELFPFLLDTNHEGWEQFGLGRNPSLIDIAFQSTHMTRAWRHYSIAGWQKGGVRDIDSLALGNTREEFVQLVQSEGIKEAVKQLFADQIENPKYRSWLEQIDPDRKGFIKNILESYDFFESTGSLLRDDLAHGFREIGPLEYDLKFQLILGLGVVKFLQSEADKFPFLEALGKNNSLGKMFLTLCIREIAPLKMLTRETDYPKHCSFDTPYNYKDTLENLEELTKLVIVKLHPKNNREALKLLVDLIESGRFNPREVPKFIKNNNFFYKDFLPVLEKFDLQYYSSMWRAVDVFNGLKPSNY